VSDELNLGEMLEKMYGDFFKGINDLFPFRSQPLPPAFQAKVHIPPLQSGFLVPPALWEGALTLNMEKLITSPPGVAWTRRQEPGKLDAALIASPQLLVTKSAMTIEVPDELLMDYGVIPDTRPPLPPAPWRWRIRNRISDWREQAARVAYRIIAGDWPDNGEDDW